MIYDTRFPYGGTNRIRFKGYNLSRTAPPSKIVIYCLAKLMIMIPNFQIKKGNPSFTFG